MVRRLRATLPLLVLCLLPLAALGAEIVVSTDGSGTFRSIQRAIDASDYGDVILVNPGIYEETIVLTSGITIRGSGPSHTIVRSSYGYDPVVRGHSVGAVILEDIALERSPSILESVVVDLQSSQVVFRNCRIAGGQLGGVRSSGLASLTFVECELRSNLGYGLLVSDASDLALRNCLVTDNHSIGLHVRDAHVAITDSTFQRNDEEGILLEGSASMQCDGITVSDNGRWGLSLTDASQATVVDSSFRTQALGNISIDDSAALELDRSLLAGGIDSAICAKGHSELRIQDTSIAEARGDGLRLDEDAGVFMEQSTVVDCGGDGVSMKTEGDCRLLHVTVAFNGGHGLEFHGRSIEATQSIFALNGGIGLSVSPSSGTNPSFRFSYNNVWGNRSGDYSGIHRSSSDISVAPEFTDVASGDFTLSILSSCIGAGEFGSTLGAHDNPQWTGGTKLEFGLARTEAAWGTLDASVRWDMSRADRLEGSLSWDTEWRFGRVELAASAIGLDRIRTRGSLQFSPLAGAETLGVVMDSTFGIVGIQDAAASRWQAWGNVQIVSGAAALRIAGSYEGPTGMTGQDFELAFRGFSLSGRATDLVLTDLRAGWEATFPSTISTVGIEVRLIPDARLALTTQWEMQGGTIRFDASSYVRQMGTVSLSLTWSEGLSTRASARLQLRSGRFEDGEILVSARLADLEVTGSLGANAGQGPRLRLDVSLDTDSWFLPRVNQPPMPEYSHTPFEPEAGEMITFDASASYDPDGELDQVWWDFGDGDTAIGRITQHVFREPGNYTISLTVSDDDGAATTWVGPFVVYEPQTTPVAAFTWFPVSEGGSRLQRPLRAGDLILLDAADSQDPNGEIVEFGWDVQSDGVFDRITPESRIIIDPLSSGSWPVTLRIVDETGRSDAVMHVLTIEDLKPPEARFDLSPAIPAVGDPIRFFDTSVGWDGTILSWEWDFGDGHASREREPSHRYQEPGEYAVRLTVRDSEGLYDTSLLTLAVNVNPELVSIQQVWALVIGISDYAEVEDLSYARRDAESIATWLLDSGVPADHIRLLTDQASGPQVDGEVALGAELATLVNVRQGLGWLRQMAGRDDMVLIHFSGHGYQGADDNLDERDGVDEFFVLQDTRATAKDDTALRDDEFGRFLDRIESDHVLVFFDSCYSGGLSRSLAPGSRATGDIVDVFSDFQLEGRLILSASSEHQDAFESPELQHGVLTHFLLQGMEGAADLNTDGHVTIWELFEYVRSEVPRFVKAERGEIQIPQLIGEGESRVVLTRSPLVERPEFSFCPAIPFAGSTVHFRSELGPGIDPEALLWDFGDGAAAVGDIVAHRYAAPGSYAVRLSVRRGDELKQTTLEVDVSDWAAVIATDELANRVVVSVGHQHGIGIGDRFELLVAEGELAAEFNPVLEVTELLDEDSSACRVLELVDEPALGTRLLPVPDSGSSPCFGFP